MSQTMINNTTDQVRTVVCTRPSILEQLDLLNEQVRILRESIKLEEMTKNVESAEEIRLNAPITNDLLNKIFGELIDGMSRERDKDDIISYIHCNINTWKNEWKAVSMDKNLNYAIMEEFIKELDWTLISEFFVPTEKYLEKFAHKLHWYTVCRCHVMPESLLRKFANRIDYDACIEVQVLSKEFLHEHKGMFDWSDAYRCQTSVQNCSDETMQSLLDGDYHEIIGWHYISTFPNLSKTFLIKNGCSFLEYYKTDGCKLFGELFEKLPEVNPNFPPVSE